MIFSPPVRQPHQNRPPEMAWVAWVAWVLERCQETDQGQCGGALRASRMSTLETKRTRGISPENVTVMNGQSWAFMEIIGIIMEFMGFYDG